jgi:hypothetical protein
MEQVMDFGTALETYREIDEIVMPILISYQNQSGLAFHPIRHDLGLSWSLGPFSTDRSDDVLTVTVKLHGEEKTPELELTVKLQAAPIPENVARLGEVLSQRTRLTVRMPSTRRIWSSDEALQE